MTNTEWRAAQEEWKDLSNWRWASTSRRGIHGPGYENIIQFGWTFNFAHPVSWFLLACLISTPLVLRFLWGLLTSSYFVRSANSFGKVIAFEVIVFFRFRYAVSRCSIGPRRRGLIDW